MNTPVIGQWTGTIAADNYEPTPRTYYYVTATVHAADPATGRPETIVLTGSDGALRAVYLIDDGSTVRPMYVAGFSKAGELYLHPFPLSGGTRPDNGRPVDMSGWALGPRKCYHVKVTHTEE